MMHENTFAGVVRVIIAVRFSVHVIFAFLHSAGQKTNFRCIERGVYEMEDQCFYGDEIQ